MNPINTFCWQKVGLLVVKAGGTYSYHWVLKGYDAHLFRSPVAATTIK
jgi:hypothetical protein